MSQTLSGSGVKRTCGRCSRTVQMVAVDGKLVACESEVIAVVATGRLGESVAVAASFPARRVHAEVCEGYRIAEEREQNRREMAAFTRRQGKSKRTTSL